MKDWLKGSHFKDAAEVQVASKSAFQEDACGGFQTCFKQLYKCWQKCEAEKGQHFEGNSV
jgi:hypothetical protein